MKKVIVIAILLSSMVTYAQTAQKAKTILDQVSQKTKSYQSITADFQFTMENSEVNLYESGRGTIMVQGNAYKLKISGVEIFCDGKNLWTFMQEADEVNITDMSQAEDNPINPATIFTIYEHGYTNNYLGEFTSEAKKTFKIEMIPDEIKEFKRVILEVDQKTYQILGAVLDGTDENRYTIKINNMNTAVNYPASTFVFDPSKYPGVNVVDMR
ncbi:MAG: outer-membrane lipoprotein carrier protein LolA [Prolixibacteraceae bacterium]|nr:outer-membrane lipoprotein carrier protein LolA [Prolixibacteraceae bacterium]